MPISNPCLVLYCKIKVMSRSVFYISFPWNIGISIHIHGVENKTESQIISNHNEIPEKLCIVDTGARWPGLES